MHYTGYYTCIRSNWNEQMFDARNLVVIGIEELDSDEDYRNLVHQEPNPEYDFENYQPHVSRIITSLKPEIFKWLEENVKDEKDGVKGWCCCSEKNAVENYFTYDLFFYRRKDAMNFIKTWSIHKRATKTYNQDTYVEKILDLKTNKLIKSQRK